MCSHWVKWQEWHWKCSTNYFQCRCFHLIHATLLLHTQLNFIEGLTVPRVTLIEELNCHTYIMCSHWVKWQEWHRKCSTNYFQCRGFHLIHATLLLHTQLNFIEGLTVPRATLIEELNCRTHSSASVFLTYPW